MLFRPIVDTSLVFLEGTAINIISLALWQIGLIRFWSLGGQTLILLPLYEHATVSGIEVRFSNIVWKPLIEGEEMHFMIWNWLFVSLYNLKQYDSWYNPVVANVHFFTSVVRNLLNIKPWAEIMIAFGVHLTRKSLQRCNEKARPPWPGTQRQTAGALRAHLAPGSIRRNSTSYYHSRRKSLIRSTPLIFSGRPAVRLIRTSPPNVNFVGDCVWRFVTKVAFRFFSVRPSVELNGRDCSHPPLPNMSFVGVCIRKLLTKGDV